ncbi:TetR/AcrR family transcriptional regulator C-terminal domain-containing protein [Dactylosporangium sp. NPDC000244]|uniref:TetR/AcrR family transcriptional regulator C-terminal domain-containing protein n=1 Tax=Dactylosporangium sp. NPDC000244 TaxID=3154365 RepID=UPI00332C25E1
MAHRVPPGQRGLSARSGRRPGRGCAGGRRGLAPPPSRASIPPPGTRTRAAPRARPARPARRRARPFFPLPNALAYGEALIAALRAGGLGAREAAWAADTVTYHVIGHVIEEQMAASRPDPAAAASRLTAAVDPARHPNLTAALPHVAAPHPEEHFEFGLRIVLAGIGAG